MLRAVLSLGKEMGARMFNDVSNVGYLKSPPDASR